MQRLLVGLIGLVLALALSACAANGNNAPENGTAVQQTPPAEATGEMPITGEDALSTNSPIPNPTQPEWPSEETGVAEGEAAEGDLIASYPNLLSELGSYAIENENGENLGSMNGFIIDRSDGELIYMVAAAGGVLGIGQQEVLVPYASLEIAGMEQFQSGEFGPAVATPEATQLPGTPVAEQAFEADPFRGAFVISGVTTDDLAQAPVFPAGDLPETASQPGWDDEVRTFWANRVDLPDSGEVAEGSNPVYLERVADLSARSANGEEVGLIEDLVVDPIDGRITHVLFTPGTGLDLDNEVYVLPFESVEWQVSEQGEQWIVLDEVQLEGASSIPSVDQLPDTTRENWDAGMR